MKQYNPMKQYKQALNLYEYDSCCKNMLSLYVKVYFYRKKNLNRMTIELTLECFYFI